MAYRIAVLDGDTGEPDGTAELLSRYGERHRQYELEITCFREIESFMKAVLRKDGNGTFDILLMNVELPGGDGIDSAQILREKGYEGVIIFTSSSGKDAYRAYSVHALHYLVKPISREKLDEAMDRAVEAIRQY